MADERSFYVEDPTPIIPDWAFLSDQCLSLEISLRRAADHLGESGRLLRAGRGSAQALEELQQAIDDRVDQLTGAARALRRYRGLSPEDSNEGVRMSEEQTPQTLRAPAPVAQPVALLPPPRPTLTDRVRALAMHPALHVALPIGALAYLRITTGKWPTIEEWIAGGTLLVARFGALAGMIQKAVGGIGDAAKEEDADPPPPVTTPR